MSLFPVKSVLPCLRRIVQIALKAPCFQHTTNDERNRIKRMEFTTKWLFVPALLGKPDCFTVSTLPFKNFVKLAQWRNDDLVHYKHEFQLPIPHGNLGKVSKVYSICNVDNSRIAIQAVREMVIKINECPGFPIPAWVLENTM